jgi:hypothetical protein
MLAKIHGDVPSKVLSQLENMHGKVVIRALRASANNLNDRVQLIENLHPNLFNDEILQKIMQLRNSKEDMKQSSLGSLWINSISDEENLPQNGYEALKSHYSIIVLNDDKDIVQKNDEQDLSDMIQEASPFLILIPKSNNSILMSSSSQYQCFCFLKDVKKLLKDGLMEKYDQKRLNMIYPMTRNN